MSLWLVAVAWHCRRNSLGLELLLHSAGNGAIKWASGDDFGYVGDGLGRLRVALLVRPGCPAACMAEHGQLGMGWCEDRGGPEMLLGPLAVVVDQCAHGAADA